MISRRRIIQTRKQYLRFVKYERINYEYFAGLVEGPHDRLDQGDCEIHDVCVVEEKIGLRKEKVEA